MNPPININDLQVCATDQETQEFLQTSDNILYLLAIEDNLIV